MSLELSDALLPDAEIQRRASLQPAGTMAGNTVQDDKDHLSSLSQTSSPRLTSILLPPSESGGPRPRSSEGRVTSLNLPKHTPRQGSSQPSALGPSRRRPATHTSTSKKIQRQQQQANGNGTGLVDDDLFNFGIGDNYAVEPEDPQVLEDVQRALKAKALREARAKSGTSALTPEPSPSKAGPVGSQTLGEVAGLQLPPPPALPVTPPRAVPTIVSRTSTPSSAAPAKITFPPYTHSPSRSLESISSDGPSGRFPVPVLLSSRDGLTYLDWSGAPQGSGTPEKDRSFLGRTFSITKRKNKEKARFRGLIGRNSLDFGASQGDLHAATLDSIRRTSKRETLSRAEITKDELGRRYAALVRRTPTGEPALDILDVVKSRSGNRKVPAPWLAWCHKRDQKGDVWTVTADSVDEYLQASGRSPPYSSVTSPSVAISARSQSPPYRMSSPFSSPRSSLSISLSNDTLRKDRRRMELGRSLSAISVLEGVTTASPLPPSTLSRSLSLTQAPTFMTLAAPSTPQRRSIDAVTGTVGMSLNDTRRASLDHGSGSQGLPTLSKTEKDSIRTKRQMSLSGDKAIPALDSRTSTMSSLTNLFGTTHGHSHGGGLPTSGRLHLGVGNMFGRMRRSGDESGEAQIAQSRSSVSDERDSGQDGEGTKSDEPARPRMPERARMTSRLEVLGMRSRGKDTSNTSDSEVGGGPFGARFGKRFRGVDKIPDGVRSAEDTPEEVGRESVSGNGRREVDALATPGWTSRRGVRRTRLPAPNEVGREELQELLRKREEEEEREREVYRARELMLIETNDHNRRMARLLKAVGALIRDNEDVQAQIAEAVSCPHIPMPPDVLDAISADPATTLRHGKGWRAVEDSHRRFTTQQALLASYMSTIAATPEQEDWSDLGDAIQEADELWSDLRVKSQQIDKQGAMVKPVLKSVVAQMDSVQREYNNTLILVETDYSEQSRIADLETIITESRAPRGWLEFAAVWIPEHVLEFIGGFIRFFGVPISEKFIRPFLWYFFRNRYYWKIYSTEPPPSERAWYTRLGYWVVVLSILAWYTTA